MSNVVVVGAHDSIFNNGAMATKEIAGHMFSTEKMHYIVLPVLLPVTNWKIVPATNNYEHVCSIFHHTVACHKSDDSESATNKKFKHTRIQNCIAK